MKFFQPFLFLILLSSNFSAKVGVYFGSFDPPHIGHLEVARSARDLLNLEKVYILPNVKPTGKFLASDFRHRYAMVRRFISKNKSLVTLPRYLMETVYSHNPSDYIGDLIRILSQREGRETTLYHICGTDSFFKMKKYGKLPRMGEKRVVAVAPRKGYTFPRTTDIEDLERSGKLILLNTDIPLISSSMIRRAIHQNRPQIYSKLPSDIFFYIRSRRLYQDEWEPFRPKISPFRKKM